MINSDLIDSDWMSFIKYFKSLFNKTIRKSDSLINSCHSSISFSPETDASSLEPVLLFELLE